ncbi:MAG: aminotransferase class I/II-fold pyridoxal phosphate-dependent enzyme, partial [Lentisphaeraceae bacterium]|nr:aminotransferase class I/II-fold pyridoxal phosphate-dependent enzyme [Lentisphaeraceae bacterium]
MNDNFIIFGSPEILQDEIDEVVDSMKSCWLGTGPKVAKFEDEFKEYKGCDHSLAVNSCTAALHLSLIAAGIKPGDEVITTALTFCATVNAIIHSGGRPVLVDVDPQTMNICPQGIKEKISSKTKAIVPVHF